MASPSRPTEGWTRGRPYTVRPVFASPQTRTSAGRRFAHPNPRFTTSRPSISTPRDRPPVNAFHVPLFTGGKRTASPPCPPPTAPSLAAPPPTSVGSTPIRVQAERTRRLRRAAPVQTYRPATEDDSWLEKPMPWDDILVVDDHPSREEVHLIRQLQVLRIDKIIKDSHIREAAIVDRALAGRSKRRRAIQERDVQLEALMLQKELDAEQRRLEEEQRMEDARLEAEKARQRRALEELNRLHRHRIEEARKQKEAELEQARQSEAREKAQQDHERKAQQDRERKAQQDRERKEREDAERHARQRQEDQRQAEEARKGGDPDRLLERFAIYEAKWKALKTDDSLAGISINDFPWPILPVDGGWNPSATNVKAFVLHPLRQDLAGKNPIQRARLELSKWHPDKLSSVVGKMHPDHRQPFLKGALDVAHVLLEIVSGSP